MGHLSLFDVMGTPGVATDLSHMNTKAKVEVRASAWPPLHPGACTPRCAAARCAVGAGVRTASAAPSLRQRPALPPAAPRAADPR